MRSGDFSSILELFTGDAELSFEEVPGGPLHGIDAIRDAYRERPPDDEIEVLGTREDDASVIARYSWRRDAGRSSAEMRLTVRDGQIARLVVTFD